MKEPLNLSIGIQSLTLKTFRKIRLCEDPAPLTQRGALLYGIPTTMSANESLLQVTIFPLVEKSRREFRSYISEEELLGFYHRHSALRESVPEATSAWRWQHPFGYRRGRLDKDGEKHYADATTLDELVQSDELPFGTIEDCAERNFGKYPSAKSAFLEKLRFVRRYLNPGSEDSNESSLNLSGTQERWTKKQFADFREYFMENDNCFRENAGLLDIENPVHQRSMEILLFLNMRAKEIFPCEIIKDFFLDLVVQDQFLFSSWEFWGRDLAKVFCADMLKDVTLGELTSGVDLATKELSSTDSFDVGENFHEKDKDKNLLCKYANYLRKFPYLSFHTKVLTLVVCFSCFALAGTGNFPAAIKLAMFTTSKTFSNIGESLKVATDWLEPYVEFEFCGKKWGEKKW